MEPKLRAAAAALSGKEVTEFQVMAWTLPCEAGFFYMRDLRHTNPFEVGLASGINWDKDFTGKEALAEIRDKGAAREVVGNEGEFVYKDGVYVGRCMKIVYSYVKEINNGVIIAEKGALKPGDHVTLHGHVGVITGTRFLDE